MMNETEKKEDERGVERERMKKMKSKTGKKEGEGGITREKEG